MLLPLDNLKPKEKVNFAVSMTDVCVRVCAGAVTDKCPRIKDEELMERVRERIMFGKRREREGLEAGDF